MHRKLATGTPGGEHRVVQSATHHLHVDHPLEVVAAVRAMASKLEGASALAG
ncbi:MAG: hypothetical protein HC923_13575 [Myxococcales bacterium]|nr:hypothetical protein [Myxococcales bacterium]